MYRAGYSIVALVAFAAAASIVAIPVDDCRAQQQAAAAVVTVVSVAGPAQKMDTTSDARQWQKLSAGDKLGEKTLIRTGLRAKVVLRFEDRGEITIDGPCKMGITQFRASQRATKTRLGLKYGTLRAEVARTHGPQDFKVVTPVATLSVRGSRSCFSCLPDNNRGLKVGVDQGNWNCSSGTSSQNAGEGENTDNQGTHDDKVNQKQDDPQQGDPFGQSDEEQDNQNENGSGRGDWQGNGDGLGLGGLTVSPLSSGKGGDGDQDPNYIGDIYPELYR